MTATRSELQAWLDTWNENHAAPSANSVVDFLGIELAPEPTPSNDEQTFAGATSLGPLSDWDETREEARREAVSASGHSEHAPDEGAR